MALVLSEDQKTLTIVQQQDNEPMTRAKLVGNGKFCTNIACITGYINSLNLFGKQENLFSNEFVAAQFDAAITEAEEDEEALFSVDKWYTEMRENAEKDEKNEPKVDWLGAFITEELKRPGFCQSLLNCIEIEEKLEASQYDRLNAACFTGRSTSFFSHGGITAPDRK